MSKNNLLKTSIRIQHLIFALFVLQFPSKAFGQLFPKQDILYTLERFESSDKPTQKGALKYTMVSDGLKVKVSGEGTIKNHVGVSYDYEYAITKADDGYNLDMASVMNPYHTRYRKDRMSWKYEGDPIFCPATIQVGSSLPDARGTIYLSTSERVMITQKVSLLNRKVSGKENIRIGENTYEAYLLSGDYTFNTITDIGQILSTEKESLIQWIVPGKGIVKEKRTGNDGSIITLVNFDHE